MESRGNKKSTGLDLNDNNDNQPLTNSLNNSEIESDVEMNNSSAKVKPEKKERERMYYADWLRALSIHFVIMVHCD